MTGYVYIDLATQDYGGYVSARSEASRCRSCTCRRAIHSNGRANTSSNCARARRLYVIVPIVFGVIFILLYMLFHSAAEAVMLIFPCIYAMTGGLILQYLMGFNFSVAVGSATSLCSASRSRPAS